MTTVEEALFRPHSVALSAQQEIQGTDPHEHALTDSAAAGLPPIAINAAQGAQLSILCRLVRAKNILEIGTLGGYSTLWFANSSPDVKVTSIEYNAKHRDVALENVKSCDNVEIILGAALDVLPTLPAANGTGDKFDFVFIDADWDNQREYFDWAVKLTRTGGCIYVDNVVRQLTKADADGSDKGRALIELVKGNGRVEASLIPTLGKTKKQPLDMVDGYLIAVVK